ncbi:Pyridoxal phosphate-dependent decarboxylase [Parasponia andersonii]|uniref:glutamate decarboxylase n=1 Tax=Parasponia andersonii TaxID=3476 RepID=A0A2P5B9F5_PARAD|nr:Pyridoxal phosphate-dependent decarboxylase [Parasponia andersonii]
MAVTRASGGDHESSTSDNINSAFATRYMRGPVPKWRMPEHTIPKEAAYQIINYELMLDGTPWLNLASFVTTWTEPERDKLIMSSINKNYVDMDEYPVTTEIQFSLGWVLGFDRDSGLVGL